MRAPHVALVAALVVALAMPTALAHGVGALAGGDTLATATPLGIPARVFEDAHAGVAVRYYVVDVARPTTLHLRLYAPEGQGPATTPVLFLFGPEFPTASAVPSDVERTNGTGALSFAATTREPASVPALGAQWTLLLDRHVPVEAGRHHLVLRTESAAPLALFGDAPGRAWLDFLVLPGLRDDARLWSGTPSWPSVAMGALGALAVAAYAWHYRAARTSLLALTARGGAALVAASALALAPDAWRSGVGWGLVGGALLTASAILAAAHPPTPRPKPWQRAAIVTLSMISLALYAGFLWGPLTAIAGALIPEPPETKTPPRVD